MRGAVERALRLVASGRQPRAVELGLSEEGLKALLEWGLANGLWVKDPASGEYSIADTGELVLSDPKLIDKLVAARPLREPNAEGISPLLKGGGLLRRVREVMDEEIVGE
mgnify:CR=1 FL=1